MSLKALPELKGFDALRTLAFEPDPQAVEQWNPALRAAEADDPATVSIYDTIGEDEWGGFSDKRMAAALRAIGPKDVTVNINSPGGDFFQGLAIYSLLRDHPARVTVQVMGLAASAASVIAMAADDLRISDVGFLMIHNAWGVVIGNRHDLRQAAETLEPFDDAMASLYARRANVDKETAAAWMDQETWLNAEQAVEAGLADSVINGERPVEAPDATTNSLAAIRRVEAALASQGLSRRERRSLLGEITNTPRPAVADETPELVGALRSLLSSLENKA
ncbi:head maturation protease, ClpP-related [Aquibaculum sediminis]|uniref:head maturation protease, ClpP-related n=1 Tax=Aquibaculum sediminis TaxID=3231907 RepID=UPI003456AC3F